MDLERPDPQTEPDDTGGPHGFDRIRTSPIAGVRPRLGVSVPGALGGVLLIGALAFGANLGVPRFESDGGDGADGAETAIVETGLDEPDGDAPADEPDGDAPIEPGDEPAADVPTDGPDRDATDKPDAEATPKPTPKPEPKSTPTPTERPEPKATPKPTPKPEPKPTEKPVLSLSLAIREGAIFIDWSACGVDGADVYKVVRSNDSTVKWPAGEGDELVAAVEIGGATKAWDEHAAPGKKAWYRVFCVRHTESGYKVLAASATKAIVAPKEPEATPKPTPAPEPSDMAIEAGVDGGNVVIHWEACGGETFSHYRILRKAGDDAQVVAEIENASTTTYVDAGLEPGTYHYAVQAKGHVGEDWFLLGLSGWVSVTVE